MNPYSATHTPPMNAGRNAGEEGDEGTEEGDDHREDGGGKNGPHRGVARNRHTAHRFAVRGVGAAAEESAHHRAYAVARSVLEAGVAQKIGADDGGKIFMVGDMFGKDDEGDGTYATAMVPIYAPTFAP